jgi:phosphoribosylaminoimidazolecarboxamide formyltransferase / IMP cyclohydrolase
MKTALISVYDKTNLEDFAYFLLTNNYQILCSGGTYKYLNNSEKCKMQNYKVIKIEDYINYPEILEGRVKTLHPRLYGGILQRNTEKDNEELRRNRIEKIDMVVVNLYPFSDTVAKESHTIDDAIENIDIGGVSLIRAGFKNYKNVLILTNPDQYNDIISQYKKIEDESVRKKFAIEAMNYICKYDTDIATYFGEDAEDTVDAEDAEKAETIYREFTKQAELKYGCNPHQNKDCCIYETNIPYPFEILNGKPGYINYLDAIQSWCLVTELREILDKPCAASFKHTTPAGVGTSKPLLSIVNDIYKIDVERLNPVSTAFIRARTADPLSSFGDFIAISEKVDEETALLIKREVSDGIIAKDYSEEALKILSAKKKGNYIILKGDENIIKNLKENVEYREINGIGLSQSFNKESINFDFFEERKDERVLTKRTDITREEQEDLIIANTTLKYTPSNSIVFACDGQVIGVGAGQQNRVDCVKLAGGKARRWCLRTHPHTINMLRKLKDDLKRQERINAMMQYLEMNILPDVRSKEYRLMSKWLGTYIDESKYDVWGEGCPIIEPGNAEYYCDTFKISMTSDAFFPFPDNIDQAYKFSVKNILQPGGSIADKSIIEACDEYGMYMILSNKRMFTH